MTTLTVLLGATAAQAGSWAFVNKDGTLSKSRGVLANFRDGEGDYRIVFRKSVAKCVPMVTLSDATHFAAAAYETGNPGEIRVFTIYYDAVLADSFFYIALVC